MSEELFLEVVRVGRQYLELWAAVDSGEIRQTDVEAQNAARAHLEKLGQLLRGKLGDDLIESARAEDLRLGSTLRGSAVWTLRDEVARVVAVADDRALEAEIEREGREARERGEIQSDNT